MKCDILFTCRSAGLLALLLWFVAGIEQSQTVYAQKVQVISERKINGTSDSFSRLSNADFFGSSITQIGDLNDDGVTDIVVGSHQNGSGERGAIWLLLLNPDGTVKSHQKINDIQGGFEGDLDDLDDFGRAVSSLGDLNGDGVIDIAVGAPGDDDGGNDRGALWVLFLNPDGRVKGYQKISDTQGNFEAVFSDLDGFGWAVSPLGDLNGDGVIDIAIGAPGDDDGGSSRGAIWILFLNPDGTVKEYQKVNDFQGGFEGNLNDFDDFGAAVSLLGDLDNDGVNDIAVGAPLDGQENHGAVWILFLNSDGTVKNHQKIGHEQSGFEADLNSGDNFGWAISSLDDFNGDEINDIAVGAVGDSDNGDSRGALWLLFLNLDGTVKAHQKINESQGSFEADLDNIDAFGFAVSPLQDLDGDQITDLVVGAPGDDDGGDGRGAIWVLFLNPNGTVKTHQKISDIQGGFEAGLNDFNAFGAAVSSIGDLDGDGINDIAVGADNDGIRTDDRGVLWVLFLNSDGTVRRHQKINDIHGGFEAELNDFDAFGAAVTSIGDINGDRVNDLVVGAPFDDDGGEDRGAIWVLFLNQDGTVKGHQKISDTQGSFEANLNDFDALGWTVSSIGDLDDDGINDLAVGAPGDDDGGDFRGAFWVLFLNSDGTVKTHQKISDTHGDFEGDLRNFDAFGAAISSLGDLDGDGINDLAIGAPLDNNGGLDRGSIWVLFLRPDGTVKYHQKISDTEGKFEGNLDDFDNFGWSVSNMGDLDGDGVTDLAIGAPGDSDGDGEDRGSLWVLFLNSDGTTKDHQKINDLQGGFSGALNNSDFFGWAVSPLQDLNDDGVTDLVVGSPNDDDGGVNRGALWILLLNTPPIFSQGIQIDTLALSNTQLKVAIEIDDSQGIDEARIAIKRAGDTQRNTIINQLIQRDDGRYEGLVQSISITDRSLEYYLEAEDIFGLTTRYPETGAFEIQVEVPDMQLGPFPTDNYRLFSIPLDLSDKSPATVLTDLGSYDPVTWRLFEPRAGDFPEEYLEFQDIDAIAPGKSYWFISTENNPLFNTGQGVSVSGLNPFPIPLVQGWNYIGNPYTFPISPSSMTLASGFSPQLQFYNGSGWIPLGSNGSIEPFEGYIVASTSEADTLFINPIEALPASAGKRASTGKTEQNHPTIRLTAQAGTAFDLGTTATIQEGASVEWDTLDHPEPPQAPGDYVSVYFDHPDWQTYFKKYTIDARPLSQDGYVWDIGVTTNVKDVVNLTAEGLDTVPPDAEIWLVDEATNTTQNLREEPRFTIAGPVESQPRRFKLIVGASSFAEEQIPIVDDTPIDFALSQNFPNPFKATTTIPFALPSDEHVTLEVYDLLGKRVRTLLGGEAKEAGRHVVIWDGRNEASQPVASGAYLLKMQAGSFVDIQQMVLVR